MAVHEDARVELVSSAPEVVVVPAPAVGEPVGGATPPRARRGARGPVLLGAAFAVPLVALAVVLLLRGGDDVVAQPTRQPSASAGEALTLSVTPPTRVVAGQPAEIVVRYADRDGRFSGSTEDWGDGVGSSSLTQGRCDGTPLRPAPARGSYTVTHTWSRPGTYPVVLGVSTYTCEGAVVVAEQASQTVDVLVGAP